GYLANAGGDTGYYFPFDISGYPNYWYSTRYQQVYDSSLFSSVPAGGGTITAISFRVNSSFGSTFSSTLGDVKIDLSTTQVGATSLSSTFANNVGSDDTTVFG